MGVMDVSRDCQQGDQVIEIVQTEAGEASTEPGPAGMVRREDIGREGQKGVKNSSRFLG